MRRGGLHSLVPSAAEYRIATDTFAPSSNSKTSNYVGIRAIAEAIKLLGLLVGPQRVATAGATIPMLGTASTS